MNLLKSIARFQKQNAKLLLVFVLLITIILGIGIKDIRLESDMAKQMPQDLPIYQLNDKIKASFGGQESVLILAHLTDTSCKACVKDIRDPDVINALIDLDKLLLEESDISQVMSAATFFKNIPFSSLEDVQSVLQAYPEMNGFFSSDYTSTLFILNADVGTSEDEIISLNKLIEEKIASIPTIPGIEIAVTGNPSVQIAILKLLGHDAVFTLLVAAAIIFFLLFIMERSFQKAIVVFTPLTIGLIWTMGILGWANIPLGFATAGLGAMILGLGVEYGVFIVSRYYEERETGQNQINSLQTSVSGIGSAILGSGLTTIIGFMALTLSVIPMMQNLGLSLAIGIAGCLVAAIFVCPAVIIVEEDLEHWMTDRKERKVNIKQNKLKDKRASK